MGCGQVLAGFPAGFAVRTVIYSAPRVHRLVSGAPVERADTVRVWSTVDDVTTQPRLGTTHSPLPTEHGNEWLTTGGHSM